MIIHLLSLDAVNYFIYDAKREMKMHMNCSLCAHLGATRITFSHYIIKGTQQQNNNNEKIKEKKYQLKVKLISIKILVINE